MFETPFVVRDPRPHVRDLVFETPFVVRDPVLPPSRCSRPGVRDTPSFETRCLRHASLFETPVPMFETPFVVRDPRPHVRDLVFETPFVVRDPVFETPVLMFETWCSRHPIVRDTPSFETRCSRHSSLFETRCSRPPSRSSRPGVRDTPSFETRCSRHPSLFETRCSRPPSPCSRPGVPGVRDPKKGVNLCEKPIAIYHTLISHYFPAHCKVIVYKLTPQNDQKRPLKTTQRPHSAHSTRTISAKGSHFETRLRKYCACHDIMSRGHTKRCTGHAKASILKFKFQKCSLCQEALRPQNMESMVRIPCACHGKCIPLNDTHLPTFWHRPHNTAPATNFTTCPVPCTCMPCKLTFLTSTCDGFLAPAMQNARTPGKTMLSKLQFAGRKLCASLRRRNQHRISKRHPCANETSGSERAPGWAPGLYPYRKNPSV